MSSDADQLLIARLGKAKGLKGEIKAHVFNPQGHSFAPGLAVTLGNGRNLTVAKVREDKPGVVGLSFQGLTSRTLVEPLSGQDIFCSRSGLPPLDDDEFYHHDLCGLAVINVETNESIGVVKGLFNFGAGDLLDIEFPDGQTEFLPFSPSYVDQINQEQKCLLIHLPKGLWRNDPSS